MNVATVGIDMEKSVFAICEGDSRGHGGRSSLLKGCDFLTWMRTLPAGTIVAMEACSSAHSWGRTMQALGLEPRLDEVEGFCGVLLLIMDPAIRSHVVF